MSLRGPYRDNFSASFRRNECQKMNARPDWQLL